MQRFYIHIMNDTSFTVDEEGREFPSVGDAEREAREAIAQILADEIIAGKNEIHLTVMIDDAHKLRVCNLKSTTRLVASVSPFAA